MSIKRNLEHSRELWRLRAAAGSIVVGVAFKPAVGRELDRLCAEFGMSRQDTVRHLVSAATLWLDSDGAAASARRTARERARGS